VPSGPLAEALARGLVDGWLVDAAIVLLLLEAAGLYAWHRRGGGLAPGRWWPMIAAGLGLLLTLRTALAGAAPAWPLACLALAGAAHARDLWLRCRVEAAPADPMAPEAPEAPRAPRAPRAPAAAPVRAPGPRSG
jgi:hypothetical protein